MDKNEAKVLLSFHSGRNSDIDNLKWKDGFLGSLRPFRGEIREENFLEIMECLKVLKDELASPLVEREVMADIVGIVCLTRTWVSPGGMLGCNHLLSEGQTKCLLVWCDIIERCLMYLLENAEIEAFSDFEAYLGGEYE